MRTQPFKITPKRGPTPGPETNPWWWNPNRVGALQAPPWFMTKLREVGEELDCRWSPVHQRWLVWMRSERVSNRYSQGWKLLFINQEPDGSYLPLDERVFARLYAASVMEHGSAKAYFDRIKAEWDRDREQRERKWEQDTIDRAMPSWEHSQIKVSGFGKSNGSKFSTYLA